MPQNLPTIDEIVHLLGLERNPYGTSYKVRCPFCSDVSKRKFYMDINTAKGVYYCFKCGTHGGMLDLYSRVKLGEPLRTGDSGNSKEIFRMIQEDRGGSTYQYKAAVDTPDFINIYPTTDKRMNEVFQCLLSFPALNLSVQHKQNLLKRGLSESTIERNGYRSIPSDDSWVMSYRHERAMYETALIDAERDKYPALRHYSKNRMIAMMIVGEYVKKTVGAPDRVPGFFKLNGIWFFRMDEGMIVPTRNHKGEIVALQMRRDSGDLRYMTVSAKGLPYGVTAKIARTHFPISNSAIGSNTIVMLTEGPLKADTAIDLLADNPDNYAFIAMHGVQAKSEIPNILQYLKEKGVRCIYNAFDMDRLLNINVMKATAELAKLVKQCGMKFISIYWAEDDGKAKVRELQHLIEEKGFSADFAEPWYDQLRKMAYFLHQQNISYCITTDENGKEIKDYWPSRSKGIDDYLLSKREAR